VDEELYDAVWTYTNENELLQLKENSSDGGEINMCQAIRELVEDGRQEGIAEGYNSGKEFGIRALIQTLCELEVSEKNITDTVARKFEISEADAISYVNKYSN
jgi:flagellar biosynthesis/type III secretory pathway protein FliH